MKRNLFLFFVIFLFLALIAREAISDPNQIQLAPFSTYQAGEEFPEDWKPLTFIKVLKHSKYSLVEEEGTVIVRGESNNSASAMKRDVNIDPKEFPKISWRWKIANQLENSDIKIRKGDDASARVMVAFEVGEEEEEEKKGLFDKVSSFATSAASTVANSGVELITGFNFETRIINYVWDRQYPIDTTVQSKATKLVTHIVVQNGDSATGEWATVERNLYEDYKNAFGGFPKSIIAIGVMTDTDATGESAVAYFGDIHLRK